MLLLVKGSVKEKVLKEITNLDSRPSIHGKSSARDDSANSLKNCHHCQVLTRLCKEMSHLHSQDNGNLLIKRMVLMLIVKVTLAWQN